MNCLLILENELRSLNRAEIVGRRAREVMKAHALKQGLCISAGVAAGKLGKATVLNLTAERIELELHLVKDPPRRYPLSLIVALPRPQTVKKLLQLAAGSGINEVFFVVTERVVKSYLQSKILHDENIQHELIKGLEQAGDTIFPRVHVEPKLEILAGSLKNQAAKALALVADTLDFKNQGFLRELKLSCPEQPVFLAIGPEAGWALRELDVLFDCGFQSVTLGERILRVEVAAAFLLGQVALLREQAVLRRVPGGFPYSGA